MNGILDQIGEYREVEVKDPNGKEGTWMAKCLQSCEDQQNQVAITTSRLPNRQTMLQWSDFCLVMEKLQKSCGHVWKRVDLDQRYPSLCQLLLKKLEIYSPAFEANKKELCKQAIAGFTGANAVEVHGTGKGNTSDEVLLGQLFKYARENLALVNIYIKPPVVTRIVKDERIPLIWFVANCGGILGLCMGFSIVTVFEVLPYLWQLLSHTCKLIYRKNNIPGLNLASKRSGTTNSFIARPEIAITPELDATELECRM